MTEYEAHIIDGLFLGRSKPMDDERGWYARVFEAHALAAAGGPTLSWADTVQSRSRRSTLRGLHYRRDTLQWKQVRVSRGAIFDVIVDLRPNSPSWQRVVTVRLSDSDLTQLIIPPGCAHGFQALTDDTDVIFNSSVPIDPALDAGIRYDDESINIAWPLSPALLNARDRTLPALRDVSPTFAQDFSEPTFS